MKHRQEATIERHRSIDPTQIALFLALVALGLAFALGTMTGKGDPARQALALEEAAAVQPWKIASRITGYVVFGIVCKVALFVFGGYGVFYLLAIGRNWLDLRARQVRAQEGLFPVIELQKGVLYDPNRDNAGAHPLITLAALGVQKQAATKADRIVIKQDDKGLTRPTQAALTQEEIANLPDLVRLADVARDPSLERLLLGVAETGPITASLYDMMHTLAVGASGFGKSAFLRALIWQLAQVKEDVGIVAIDPSGSEFNPIQHWARLLYPVARDTDTAILTLQAVSQELEKRKGLYEACPQAYDLPSYNRLAPDKLSPVVILTDEGTNLLNQDGIGEALRAVAQTARQYGVYLLLAGQSAKHSVIDTQVRDNFSTRLCFHTSPSSYRTVLGESVSDVTTKGRAWAQLTGKPLLQVQCPYVSREEVADVLTTGKPRFTITANLEAVTPAATARPKAGEDADTVARVVALKAAGKSDTAIAQEVYHHGNTHYIEKVRGILQQQQQAAGAIAA